MRPQTKPPLFQHRHYEAIAVALTKHLTLQAAVSSLADMFERDNANFDREQFYTAMLEGFTK